MQIVVHTAVVSDKNNTLHQHALVKIVNELHKGAEKKALFTSVQGSEIHIVVSVELEWSLHRCDATNFSEQRKLPRSTTDNTRPQQDEMWCLLSRDISFQMPDSLLRRLR